MWKYNGSVRPDFALAPNDGQESVWDYPRPPDIRADAREVIVTFGGHDIACTSRSLRICETAGPPVFYLPPADINFDLLRAGQGQSLCEWKGFATYYDVITPEGIVEQAAWTYEDPLARFKPIGRYLSFYPGKVECLVAGERARPQHGGFYGGWVTDEIAGPWKGEPGTGGW